MGTIKGKADTDKLVIEEQNEIFLLASKISFDGIWDWNILTNEFFLGEGFKKLFGRRLRDKTFDWTKHLHPDDKLAVESGLKLAIESSATYWEQAYRFIRPNGSIARVLGRASIIRDADGNACRMIGSIHDLSRQKDLEKILAEQARLNEQQITEAAEDAKELERSDIGKELHDNVNQLLAASRLYLEIARKGGENSELYLSRSSEFTLIAIEEIRKLTKGLTTNIIKSLGLCGAIESICQDNMELNPVRITWSLDRHIEQIVNDKFKLNVYRIFQEQLSNIIKHAGATAINISLLQDKKLILLSIADDGIGFDTNDKSKGIGIANIKSRAKAFKGIAEFTSRPGQGCVLYVTFPVSKLILL